MSAARSIATLPCAAAGAAANRNSAPSARADSAAGMAERPRGRPAASGGEKREKEKRLRRRGEGAAAGGSDGPTAPHRPALISQLSALCISGTGTTGSVAKMRLLERLMKTLKMRIGALLLERHEKWQLEKQPYFSTPKVSSFNAFSHYQDW